ncbi:putative hydroxymandelonitrile lyase [Lupinus albus]|uniref:Putative hydroxymandelonitrile lyase n=1 Tax=Lupinus albus TaxID=3870 RepID=A0A6A4NIA8_LUPAL|nr:putative hydroxymandelonitrile lyase [Lupinus albus]
MCIRDVFSDFAAEDAYIFLINWFERFPQYKRREVYIAGESTQMVIMFLNWLNLFTIKIRKSRIQL